MSVTSRLKLLRKLRNKQYRDAYVEQNVKTSLPFQIRTLREQPEREWSQGELGERADMRQNAISRLENADYGNLNINTLLRLASAFDVALLVKFVPFRKLLDEFKDLSANALEVGSFDQEIEGLEQVAISAETEPLILGGTATASLVYNSSFPAHANVVIGNTAIPTEVRNKTSAPLGFGVLGNNSIGAEVIKSPHIH